MNATVTDSPPGTAQPMAAAVRQTFVLQSRHGLHCRPASLLIKQLKDFDCNVLVAGNGAVANGRSIIGLLTLAAGYGTKLTFTVTGPDAVAAMGIIQNLFANNFTDAYIECSAAIDLPVTTGRKKPGLPVVTYAKHATQTKANYEEPSPNAVR